MRRAICSRCHRNERAICSCSMRMRTIYNGLKSRDNSSAHAWECIFCSIAKPVCVSSGSARSRLPRAEGPAVVLRDATARRVPRPENGKTNSADAISLPPAKLLTGFDLLRPENDATRVSVQARLLGLRTDGAEEIMELQQGHRTF